MVVAPAPLVRSSPARLWVLLLLLRSREPALAVASRVPDDTGRTGGTFDAPDTVPVEWGRLMLLVLAACFDGGAGNDELLRIALDGRVFGVLDDDLLLGSSLSFSFSWTLFLK